MPARQKAMVLWLALACSWITGAAQLTTKWGADRVRQQGWSDPTALLAFAFAYAMLGVGFLLLLLALRGGELSTIYPVLAARYLWVVALTPILFSTETFDPYKLAGAGLAALGVWAVIREGAS